MPARQVLKTIGQVRRVLASNRCYVTCVRIAGDPELKEFTLTPQGTTNPGTKELPIIYFDKIKDIAQFEQFRKTRYVSRRYILVPGESQAGSEIYFRTTGMGGDYVKTGSLEPSTDQYVVEIGKDFETEEVGEHAQASPAKSTSWLAFFKIL